MNLLPEITALFRPTTSPTLRQQLEELQGFTRAVATWGTNYSKWYLGAASKDEALQYEVYDGNGVTPAAYAVLKTRNGGREDADDIGFWNGEDEALTAGIGYTIGVEGRPQIVSLRPRVDPTLTWRAIANVIEAAAMIWSPLVVTAFTATYFPQKVFKDRPGVGWMLYLPRELTVQQVPEARALVPVMSEVESTKIKPVQLGTIIVSVTDEPFSNENPEHVKIANAIEIRLVDQDLLPLYSQL